MRASQTTQLQIAIFSTGCCLYSLKFWLCYTIEELSVRYDKEKGRIESCLTRLDSKHHKDDPLTVNDCHGFSLPATFYVLTAPCHTVEEQRLLFHLTRIELEKNNVTVDLPFKEHPIPRHQHIPDRPKR